MILGLVQKAVSVKNKYFFPKKVKLFSNANGESRFGDHI